LLLLAGIAGAIVLVGDALTNFIRDRFIVQTFIEGYASSRDLIAEQALEMFLIQPIRGVGLDGFFALQSGTAFSYPHSLLLGSASEGGVIAVLLLIAAVAVLFVSSKSMRPMPATTLMALCAGAFLLISSMFSGDFYDSRLMWFFLIWAAIASKNAAKMNVEIADEHVVATMRRTETGRKRVSQRANPPSAL